MPLRFVMQPRFSLSIQIYGLQPLSHAQLFLVIPTLDLRSLTLHRARLVVNGTTLVLARVIPRVRRTQGIINVEFVLKTILCSISSRCVRTALVHPNSLPPLRCRSFFVYVCNTSRFGFSTSVAIKLQFYSQTLVLCVCM